MNEEKTRLEAIVEQKSKQLTRAIVEAIEDGAKIKRELGGGISIDGLYVQKPCYEQHCDGVVVLKLFSEELKAALADDAEMLAKRKADLERQITEIDNQLNSMKQ